MNWITIGKFVIGGIASFSVGTVIDNAVKVTTPKSASSFNQGIARLGGFILSGMVSKHASNYVINELSEMFNIKDETEKEESNEVSTRDLSA